MDRRYQDISNNLSFLTLESGIADMIVDNLQDLEEIVIEDKRIRKTNNNTFKIYELNTNKAFTFNTQYNYDTRELNDPKILLAVIKDFITEVLDIEYDNEQEDFIKDIIIKVIKYFFKVSKNMIICFFNELEIEEFIKQNINDCIEDIIYQSQFNYNVRQLYNDYEFNFQEYEVIVEEEDLEDINLDDYMAYRDRVGQNINRDNMIVSLPEPVELERFKEYLQSKGKLLEIELQAIVGAFHILNDYDTFINRLRYIVGLEPINEESDTDDDF